MYSGIVRADLFYFVNQTAIYVASGQAIAFRWVYTTDLYGLKK